MGIKAIKFRKAGFMAEGGTDRQKPNSTQI